ncbi:MAG TPA: hypothetical protein VNK49_08900 [Anaerolineales bacterium]|nr:hypothetical protein [Anaerolineales bacterium]
MDLKRLNRYDVLVMKAARLGLVSKLTASLSVPVLSPQNITTSLTRLVRLGFLQEQHVAKIEKKGRPEKVYRLTQDGVGWLHRNGFDNVVGLTSSDPLELAHRYCQALVGALTPDGTKVEFEKIFLLADGRNVRIDVVVPLSDGAVQFIEIEQRLERNNLARAVEKFERLGEFFRREAGREVYRSDVLFIFNLSAAALPKTLRLWQEALGSVFPGNTPIPFTPRYTTIDTFISDPAFTDLERFPLIEKREGVVHPSSSGGGVLDYKAAPHTKQVLAMMDGIKRDPVNLHSHEAEQLTGFCEIAMNIYRKSMRKDSPTRKYAAFPHESVQALRDFLHLPPNAALLRELKKGYAWIESRKSGLILYRDAVTRLIWDVIMRHFGIGRGGPLDIFVGIPDLGEKASGITIDVILEKSEELRLPWTSGDETYEDAISWMLTALFLYPVDLGLADSLWESSRRKGGERGSVTVNL